VRERSDGQTRRIAYGAVTAVLLVLSVVIGFANGWLWGVGTALTVVNVAWVLYVFDGRDDLEDDGRGPAARRGFH
jgi:hypothetical protein